MRVNLGLQNHHAKSIQNTEKQTQKIGKPNYVNIQNFSYQRSNFPRNYMPYFGANLTTETGGNLNKARSPLEKMLFESVESKTPDYIKAINIIDMSNPDAYSITLKKEYLEPYDAVKNPEGMNLKEWLANYKKEALVSTAGIRGSQNVLHPSDPRFPINLFGIALATEAKALAAEDIYKDKDLVKIAGREVRYNSDKMVDLIARIQASHGIKTLTTEDRESMPIWMASFLAFKLDLLGGEYVTSSHGISVKNATKDLNSQGSQYLPEESMKFVEKIEQIFKHIEENGSYDIKLSANNDKLINSDYLKSINNGVDLYVEYLKKGVANDVNLGLIKQTNTPVVIENVGGSAYKTLDKVLQRLDIADKYHWLNTEEDPFFHGIGKTDVSPKGKKEFYDYSVDATIIAKGANGKPSFPVIETMGYDEKLKEYPVGTSVLITDPDHDRLTITQIQTKSDIPELEKAGIDYVELDGDRILSVPTANQSFLLIMDFWAKQLRESEQWDNHPRLMIKTTASARSWDEWAEKNDVKVINVPVGFKEIANIMKKVEKQLDEAPDKEVIITDVYGKDVNLGIQPRLIFAGEESGGMIIGGEDLIESKTGRKAIAMREKSAGESIIIASALASNLKNADKTLSSALNELYDSNNIISRYDVREDITYYNESEPDIDKLKAAKKEGEEKRTKNDIFFLTMAIAKNQGQIELEPIKEILSSTFPELKFDNLQDVQFVGDGTMMIFDNKSIEIRPSGTDAKTKAYGVGEDKNELKKYAQTMGQYSGDRNQTYNKYISDDLYQNSKKTSNRLYQEFTDKGANNQPFVPPVYYKTLGL
ncbi:MAG: hypothetical protein PHX18_08655 [Candidatus Gastranaerophilales bacterium]|nr:hypothetical protein [Candidatus Gastranaerophilales bacterium]